MAHETATSFEVRESGGCTSSLSFDYRIVARCRRYEAQRLTDVTERFKAETKALARHIGEPIRPAARPLLLPKPNASTPRRMAAPTPRLPVAAAKPAETRAAAPNHP